MGSWGRALLQVRKGTLLLGMRPCRERFPCPGTIPRDVESHDHIIKHPSHATPFPIHFSHLLGAVGAGSHIPVVMGGQVTANRSILAPPTMRPGRQERGPLATSPAISKGASLVHPLLRAFNDQALETASPGDTG